MQKKKEAIKIERKKMEEERRRREERKKEELQKRKREEEQKKREEENRKIEEEGRKKIAEKKKREEEENKLKKEFPQQYVHKEEDLLLTENNYRLLCLNSGNTDLEGREYKIYFGQIKGLLCGIKEIGEKDSIFITFKRPEFSIYTKKCELQPILLYEGQATDLDHAFSSSISNRKTGRVQVQSSRYFTNFPVFDSAEKATEHFLNLWTYIHSNIEFEEDEDMFEYEYTSEGYTVHKYIDYEHRETITIPDYHMGIPVVTIGGETFINHHIKNLFIGKNIRRIQGFPSRSAFSTFGFDTTIHFKKGKTIELTRYAFNGFRGNIEGIDIGTDFEPDMLAFCKAHLNVSNLNIAKQSYLQDKVFKDCKGIENVIIHEPVTRIGEQTFYGSSVKKVVLPKTVESIGDEAFWGCYSLHTIYIPSSVINIGKKCFMATKEIIIHKRKDGRMDLRYKDPYMFVDSKLDVVIECEKGSYAHIYAIENDLKFAIK